jgi:hypothetical protein
VNDAAILDKMCKGSIKIKVFLDSSSKLAIVKK